MRFCNRCSTIKNSGDFYSNITKIDNIATSCKECSKLARIDTYNADPSKEIANNEYRKRQMHTPLWANKEQIKQWHLNRPQGMHVDHIIPINGEIVCGLNVETNLQYLTIEDNLSKGNKYNQE